MSRLLAVQHSPPLHAPRWVHSPGGVEMGREGGGRGEGGGREGGGRGVGNGIRWSL